MEWPEGKEYVGALLESAKLKESIKVDNYEENLTFIVHNDESSETMRRNIDKKLTVSRQRITVLDSYLDLLKKDQL